MWITIHFSTKLKKGNQNLPLTKINPNAKTLWRLIISFPLSHPHHCRWISHAPRFAHWSPIFIFKIYVWSLTTLQQTKSPPKTWPIPVTWFPMIFMAFWCFRPCEGPKSCQWNPISCIEPRTLAFQHRIICPDASEDAFHRAQATLLRIHAAAWEGSFLGPTGGIGC